MTIERDVVQWGHLPYQLAVLNLQIQKVNLLIGVTSNNSHLEFAGRLSSKGKFLSGNSLKVGMIVLKEISTPLHLFISLFPFSVSWQNSGDSP